MDSSTKGLRRAALLMLALAMIMAGTLAVAAPRAVQQQGDAAKDAGTALVSAPSQVDLDGAGNWSDQGHDGESGTTDGDPDVPLARSAKMMQILIIRVTLLAAVVGI